MTITNETILTQTAGNGTTTRYYFTFTIYDDTDLDVYVVDDTDAETDLVLNSDYTVSVSGKYIDLTAGTLCPTGSTLNILSSIPYTQETDLVDGGSWNASLFNVAFDKLTILILQVKSLVGDILDLAAIKADTDIASAISLKHSNSLDHAQNTDVYLDYGGSSQVSATQVKTAYTHSQVVTGNPHSVAKSDIGLGNVANVEQIPLSYLDADGDLTANSDSKVPTQKAVKKYVDDNIVTGAGGVVGPASNTDGNIPQWDGVDSNTLKDGLILVTSIGNPGSDTKIPSEAAVRSAISSDGGGDVSGPSSATDRSIVLFAGTDGKAIQDSSVTIDDNGSVDIPAGQSYKINGTALCASDVEAAASDHYHVGVYKAVGANETENVTAASDTSAGKVELATISEINAGTDSARD